MARSYVPTLYRVVKWLASYMAAHQDVIMPWLANDDARTQFSALMAACNALIAAIDVTYHY